MSGHRGRDVVETFVMVGLALLVFMIATTTEVAAFVLIAAAILIVTTFEFCRALFVWLRDR